MRFEPPEFCGVPDVGGNTADDGEENEGPLADFSAHAKTVIHFEWRNLSTSVSASDPVA